MARRGENIHKRKDGRWEGRYIKARTPDRRICWGYIYGTTYAEVKQRLIHKKSEYSTHLFKKIERPSAVRPIKNQRDITVSWQYSSIITMEDKPKTVTADFTTQIAEKQSAKDALTAEIASITANMDSLKADLKEKKASLKATDKEIVKLEAKKAKADAKAAEETKKAEAESVLKKLLAEGMSADEILEKLK